MWILYSCNRDFNRQIDLESAKTRLCSMKSHKRFKTASPIKTHPGPLVTFHPLFIEPDKHLLPSSRSQKSGQEKGWCPSLCWSLRSLLMTRKIIKVHYYIGFLLGVSFLETRLKTLMASFWSLSIDFIIPSYGPRLLLPLNWSISLCILAYILTNFKGILKTTS